jgi:hypothetical protein
LVHLVGEAGPKLNFSSLCGWLEGESRRSSLRKFALARHLGAKASRSKIQKWSVTQTANIQNSGAADQCQIDFEIICVPHGTPRHMYRKLDLKLPFLPRSAADQQLLICC